MNTIQKNAVQQYQCPGCAGGPFPKCFTQHTVGIGCASHVAGTTMNGIGRILLGLPIGFNRMGAYDNMKVIIFEKWEDGWKYDTTKVPWNVPVWKHLTAEGHTIVRGYSPRLNVPWLHIYLTDCMKEIACKEITAELQEMMD